MKSFDRGLLPPEQFQIMKYTEQNFQAIGNSFADYFVAELGLKNTDRVLEIGSGNGRIASSLARYIDEGEYVGVDIMKPFIEWCQSAYKNYPNFTFKHINVYNKYYNKYSFRRAKKFKFPFPDESFDLIFLTSVFTHMYKEDVDNYLSEIQRMLKPNSHCVITYFLIDDTTLDYMGRGKSTREFIKFDDVTYAFDLKIPEAAIAFDKSFIEDLYSKNNLKITSLDEGKWRHPTKLAHVKQTQDRVVAIKP